MHGGGHERHDVVVDLPFPRPVPGFDPSSLRVVEATARGPVVCPAQYDGGEGPRLAFLAPGVTGAGATRRFHVYVDTVAPAGVAVVAEQVRLDEVDGPEAGGPAEVASYRTTTPAGRWWYDRRGGALWRLEDGDGHDWIGWRDEQPPSSAGWYRGIPQFHERYGNFHPGSVVAETKVVRRGPLAVALRSTSTEGGQFAYETIHYPGVTRCTVLAARAAGDDSSRYWWVYEGTPGGERSTADPRVRPEVRVVRGNAGHGTDRSVAWARPGRLAAPDRWALYRVPGLGTPYGRVLFLAHHEDDGTDDAHYLAALDGSPAARAEDGYMVVFGFGRGGLAASLDGTRRATFSMGLLDPAGPAEAVAAVRAAARPLPVTVGPVEHRP